MSTNPRVLNLDEDNQILVTIGGREFTIRQMSKPKLEQILSVTYQQKEMEATTPETDGALLKMLSENWDRELPILAMLFGHFDANSDETLGVIAHLQEHLTVPGGIKLFQAWWDLNDISGFFMRCGMPTVPPSLARSLTEDVTPAAS